MSPESRRCLVMSGPAAAARRLLAQGLADYPGKISWVGEAPAPFESVALSAAPAMLGGECDILVYDMHAGLDANALGALSGTVRGGGWLVLITPPLAEWPAYPDPLRARFATWPCGAEAVGGRFIGRLVSILRRHPAVTIHDTNDALPDALLDAGASHVAPPAFELTADQAGALQRVMRVGTGHARRPVVLTSDRGRGKSTVLAHAVAAWLRADIGDILLVVPRAAASEVFWRTLADQLPGIDARAGGQIRIGNSCLRGMLPGEDGLCEEARRARVILVDEAAAVPVHVLSSLLDLGNRLVFATTVHGYEGSGRGFELRFKAELDERMPGWREVRLAEPVRWAPGDGLEDCVGRMLLLDTGLPRPGDGGEAVSVERVPPGELVADEECLAAVFGLLVNAHYQTRPSDLHRLLDAPAQEIWLARCGGELLGVAQVVEEGGLDADLARAVSRGERRPRGHLLAQSLAAHGGFEEAARRRLVRVMRIAVHPGELRRGIGSRLLDAIAVDAAAAGHDALGVSFGLTADNLGFWQANAFHPVRLGTRLDAASGTFSLQMLRPLGDPAWVDMIARHFRAQLPWGMGSNWRSLQPDLASLLMAGRDCSDLALSSLDLADLRSVGWHHRDPRNCPAAIWKAAVHLLAAPREAGTSDGLGALAVSELQHRSCDGLPGRTGHKACLAALRELARWVSEHG